MLLLLGCCCCWDSGLLPALTSPLPPPSCPDLPSSRNVRHCKALQSHTRTHASSACVSAAVLGLLLGRQTLHHLLSAAGTHVHAGRHSGLQGARKQAQAAAAGTTRVEAPCQARTCSRRPPGAAGAPGIPNWRRRWSKGPAAQYSAAQRRACPAGAASSELTAPYGCAHLAAHTGCARASLHACIHVGADGWPQTASSMCMRVGAWRL